MRTLEDHICVFCFIGKNLLQAKHPALYDSFAGKKFQQIGFVCCMKFPTNSLRLLYEIYRKSFTLFLVLFWRSWYNQRHRRSCGCLGTKTPVSLVEEE